MKKLLAILVILMLLAPCALAEGGTRASLNLTGAELFSGGQLVMDLSKLGLHFEGVLAEGGASGKVTFTADRHAYDATLAVEEDGATVLTSILPDAYRMAFEAAAQALPVGSVDVSAFAGGEIPVGVDLSSPYAAAGALLDKLDAALAGGAYAQAAAEGEISLWSGETLKSDRSETFEVRDISLAEFGDAKGRTYALTGKRHNIPEDEKNQQLAMTVYDMELEVFGPKGKPLGKYPAQFYAYASADPSARSLTVEAKEDAVVALYAGSDGETDNVTLHLASARADQNPVILMVNNLRIEGEYGKGDMVMWALSAPEQASEIYLNDVRDDAGTYHAVTLTYEADGQSGELFYEGAVSSGESGYREEGTVTWTDGNTELRFNAAYETESGYAGALYDLGGKAVVDASKLDAQQLAALQNQAVTSLMSVMGAILQAAPDASVLLDGLMAGQ